MTQLRQDKSVRKSGKSVHLANLSFDNYFYTIFFHNLATAIRGNAFRLICVIYTNEISLFVSDNFGAFRGALTN